MIRDPTTLAQANINKKMSLYRKKAPSYTISGKASRD
jgi:hypothetical protein